MYEAHVRREAVMELRHRRDSIVGGAWANPNFDGEGGDRRQFLETIDEMFENSVSRIYGFAQPEDEVDFATDPFFAAMKLPELADDSAVEMGRDPKLSEMLSRVEIDVDQ
jgi:hypothetical protein